LQVAAALECRAQAAALEGHPISSPRDLPSLCQRTVVVPETLVLPEAHQLLRVAIRQQEGLVAAGLTAPARQFSPEETAETPGTILSLLEPRQAGRRMERPEPPEAF